MGHLIPIVGSFHLIPLSCDGLNSAVVLYAICDRAQCQESVGEAGRYPKFITVFRGEDGGNPLAVCRRAFANVHGHIENLTKETADKLPLRGRLLLEVEAS
jgi:hypothetical protein